MTVRYTVHFNGRVQGVGFRYTAVQIAERHELAGFVQNLPDGQVTVVAEGKTKTLDEFVADVQKQMADFINDTHIEPSPATGAFGPAVVSGLLVRY